MVVTQTVQQGLNGFRSFRGRLRGRAAVPLVLEPGTPSLAVAVVEGSPAQSSGSQRLVLVAPDGLLANARTPGCAVVLDAGSPRAYVVNDPAEGTWTLRVDEAEPSDGRLDVAAVAAAQDEPRDSLLAAAATMPDDAAHGLPRGVLELLLPVCVALRPLCGRGVDALPPALVAASDLTGAHPDDIQDALEDVAPGSPTWRIAQALAHAAGI